MESFLIANSLYTKKYELVHRIMVAVNNSEHKKKALNQYFSEFGREGIYNEMVLRFYEPKTRIRLSGAYYYQRFFIGESPYRDSQFLLLRDKTYASYKYLRAQFGTTVASLPKVLSDGAEHTMFSAWFPVQKGVATAMGRAIISTRGKVGLVTTSQALAMEEKLEPGDIMLQRRNWHISNVGIPGFWTHSALYTGDLKTMDEYFSSEFPYKGYESFSAYVQGEMPVVHQALSTSNKVGDFPAVIEAIEPGVVLQSLPVSASADYIVVLRPNLHKQDKMLAILKAFANFGKPYDFNFDFDTRDALVCSELVYDAYFERLPEKKGVHMETSVVNGRKIVSPYDIATKYVAEQGTDTSELQFIYFLQSDESRDIAFVSTESAFIESLEWSKFSFMQKKVGE